MSILHTPFSFTKMLKIGKSIHARLIRFRNTLFADDSGSDRSFERDRERSHHVDYSPDYLYEIHEQSTHRGGARIRRFNGGNRIHPMY
jgi:hypothetical protein